VIIRLVRVTASSGAGPALNAHFRDVAQPRIRACRGNEGVWYGRQVHQTKEEFVMISRWADYASMREWTGPKVNQLPLLPNIGELADEWTVQHFEELEESAASDGTPP
jgi:hypothetical protein